MKGLAVRFALIILSAPTPSALGFVLTTKVDKMVVFLFNDAPQFGINCQGSIESKGRKLCPLGTAFYTGFPDKEDKAKCWSVIATAQHVVRGQRVLFGADATPTDMTLYARNTTGQDEVCAPLDSAKWKYFSDPKLDVAVYLSNVPGMERTECVQAPMFATEATLKEKRITQGDSVFTLAMVPELVGAKRNYPVARQGTLALLETNPDAPGEGVYYFAGAQSYPGNSGAPVFLALGGLRGGTLLVGQQVYLIGITRGFLAQETQVGIANIGLERFVRVDVLLRLLCDAEVLQFLGSGADTSACSSVSSPKEASTPPK